MKYIIDIKDGHFVDVGFGADSDLIKYYIHKFRNSNNKDNDFDILIERLGEHLRKCKHKQHVFMIFSDEGVVPVMSLDEYIKRNNVFIDESEMNIDE